MARSRRSVSLGPVISRGELIGGIFYLPFYLILLSWILVFLSGLLGLGLDTVRLNTAYFLCNFAAVWLIFRRFLAASFRAFVRDFWPGVQAVILGLALYYFLNLLLGLLLRLTGLSFVNPNQEAVSSMLQARFPLMVLCTVVLAPVTEEVLVRGLIFSTIHEKSRILAYAVSILAFSLIHTLSYVSSSSARDLLFSALAYVPASAALAWTYEKAGSIWGPIFLHSLINAFSAGLLQWLGSL